MDDCMCECYLAPMMNHLWFVLLFFIWFYFLLLNLLPRPLIYISLIYSFRCSQSRNVSIIVWLECPLKCEFFIIQTGAVLIPHKYSKWRWILGFVEMFLKKCSNWFHHKQASDRKLHPGILYKVTTIATELNNMHVTLASCYDTFTRRLSHSVVFVLSPTRGNKWMFTHFVSIVINAPHSMANQYYGI